VYAGAGHPIAPAMTVDGDFTFDGGRSEVARLLDAGVEFDAVFAHNDLSAAGAMRALRAAGRDIPADVAVVGFDDVPLASHLDPPLTTVHQPMREMGEAAARMLLTRVAGAPAPGRPTVIETTLIVRESTGHPDAATDRRT
jgi:LacI family transcriptional regulator